MLFMINAQLKYTSFGILTIFIKLIQTTPSDVEAFDLFLPHFTIYELNDLGSNFILMVIISFMVLLNLVQAYRNIIVCSKFLLA